MSLLDVRRSDKSEMGLATVSSTTFVGARQAGMARCCFLRGGLLRGAEGCQRERAAYRRAREHHAPPSVSW
jgi:hypothetical protein